MVGNAQAANDRHGWYMGLEAGWVKVNDSELPAWGYDDIEFDNRWGMLGTVGYAFEGNWRLEFEGGYRNNDIDRIDTVAISDGELAEWSGMFNAIYNQRAAEKWTIDFGVGVGADNVRFDDNLGNEDADTVLAAQGLVGVTYKVGPHWDIMLNYRYLWLNDPEFTDASDNVDEMAIAKHTISLGFRFGYDGEAPPPPPPPPPPPAPAPQVKQFIIFFGFDRCDITPEADRVLTDASAAAKSDGVAAVKIVGHTDTSGSVAYNQRLSECRSGAAKTNMVGKGVPANAISTSGRGEGDLMVQTGDGVKEPQNRRATVELE
jgi:outer membrane protein OmpA-like peptidoglycan-associated protein